jgi:outer membrane lipoprotein-sorting protein
MKTFKLFASFLLLAVFAVPAAAQKMTAEDVLAKHLDSIGKADVRASVRNQMAVGDVVFKFVSSKSQPAEGRVVMVSEGVKYFFGMNLNAADYPTERLVFDGKKSKAAFTLTNRRSILGDFVTANDLLLEDSLLGGTLSTSWALANLATNKARLSYEDTKEVDGKSYHVLGYSPKGGGDLTIRLFFDKDNFRHVRTEYKRTSSAGIGLRAEDSSRFRETRLTLTETFDDFKAERGITLPHTYTLNYTISGQNGTSEVEWKFNFTQFAFNQALDAKTFETDPK